MLLKACLAWNSLIMLKAKSSRQPCGKLLMPLKSPSARARDPIRTPPAPMKSYPATPILPKTDEQKKTLFDML